MAYIGDCRSDMPRQLGELGKVSGLEMTETPGRAGRRPVRPGDGSVQGMGLEEGQL